MRYVRFASFGVVLAFSVSLFDHLVLANFGVRLLPIDYETLETTFFVLAAVSPASVLLSSEGAHQVALHRLVVLLCVPPMLATVAGFLGPLSQFLDLFSHFRAQYAGSLLLGALALFVLRKSRWAWVTSLAALVNVFVMAPQLAGWPTAVAGGDPSLRLVLANVNVSNRHYRSVTHFLEKSDPDVFVLEEIDSLWAEEVAKLDQKYPYSVVAAHGNTFGIGLFSRFPLEARQVVTLVDETVPSIAARIDVSGTELVVLGDPSASPTGRRVRWAPRPATRRARGARARRRSACRRARGSEHHALGILISQTPIEIRSHGFEPGLRLQWSWPAGFWPLAIAIDRCLVLPGVRVVDRFMGPDIGSDHYPLVVDISLTPR